MSRLPTLRSREAAAALHRAGFEDAHQRGSHLHLKHSDGREVVIPMHSKDLKRSTLLAIIKQAGLSQDEFRNLL